MRPTPHSVTIRRRVAGERDAHRNVTYTLADPEDVAVYAIAPGESSEPTPGRHEVVSTLTVYAPPDINLPTALDVVEVDGVAWEVHGDPADWTRGPYGSRQGVTFSLKRVTG